MSGWAERLDLLIRADVARCIHDRARENRVHRPDAVKRRDRWHHATAPSEDTSEQAPVQASSTSSVALAAEVIPPDANARLARVVASRGRVAKAVGGMTKDDSTSEMEESMSEDYRTLEVRGEPLPAGCVGARVRVGLSGCPSRRWSRVVSARLASELIGHAAVGHLRLNELVQGDQIVLEGVEASEVPALAGALKRAIDAANRAYPSAQNPSANMTREQADAIANQIAPEPRLFQARGPRSTPATR